MARCFKDRQCIAVESPNYYLFVSSPDKAMKFKLIVQKLRQTDISEFDDHNVKRLIAGTAGKFTAG